MSTLDFNVKVTIEAPTLVEAVNRLCDRLVPVPPAAVPAAPTVPTTPTVPVESTPSQNVVQFPSQLQNPSEAPSEPVQTQAAPTVPTSPDPVPTAPPPTMTAKPIDLNAISRAGASLVDSGRMPEVLAVLKDFGVEAITQLRPDAYPAFADRLRALGATV